jgi:hypothetical protein
MRMRLSSPTQIVWIIALILGLLGLLGYLDVITSLTEYAFWLVAAGWALLLVATAMRGL